MTINNLTSNFKGSFCICLKTNSLDPEVKALFDAAGVTEESLKDKDTAEFLYDFIEQAGGVEGIKKYNAAAPKAPPPAPPPAPPAFGTGGKENR